MRRRNLNLVATIWYIILGVFRDVLEERSFFTLAEHVVGGAWHFCRSLHAWDWYGWGTLVKALHSYTSAFCFAQMYHISSRSWLQSGFWLTLRCAIIDQGGRPRLWTRSTACGQSDWDSSLPLVDKAFGTMVDKTFQNQLGSSHDYGYGYVWRVVRVFDTRLAVSLCIVCGRGPEGDCHHVGKPPC